MGVDFASYLSGVNQSIHKSWLTLVPDVVRPPTTKKGKVVIEWSITKDGSPSDLRLVSSSNDAALDRAAPDAITSSAPFPPLPADFKGPFVATRLTFLYNPGPADPALSESIWRLETRFRENLNTDKNADADLNRELVTLTSLLSSGNSAKPMTLWLALIAPARCKPRTTCGSSAERKSTWCPHSKRWTTSIR